MTSPIDGLSYASFLQGYGSSGPGLRPRPEGPGQEPRPAEADGARPPPPPPSPSPAGASRPAAGTAPFLAQLLGQQQTPANDNGVPAPQRATSAYQRAAEKEAARPDPRAELLPPRLASGHALDLLV